MLGGPGGAGQPQSGRSLARRPPPGIVPPMDDDPQGDFEDQTPDETGDNLGEERLEFDPDATPPPPGGRGCLLILALPLLAGLRLFA